MSAGALLAVAALSAAPVAYAPLPPQTADERSPRPRLSLLTEGSVSAAYATRGQVAVGGRVSARLGPGAYVLSLDLPPSLEGPQPRMKALLLGGPGIVKDLSPRLGAHGELLLGLEFVDLDDYVDGIAREVIQAAAGARAGLEWRDRTRNSGDVGAVPVVGLSATLLYVQAGSDRLRGIEWGGFTALLSLTLGLELATPPREPRPAVPVAPLAEEPRPAPPPEPAPPPTPRLPRLAGELGVNTSVGDGPPLGGAGRVSWAPAPRLVVAAEWQGGEKEPGEVHHYVTAGAGARTLRRGWVLEALALGGVHRIEERDTAGWRAQHLPAVGARAGILRAPRGGGVSFLYGASATVLVSRTAESLAARGDVGGLVGIFAASLGIAL